MIANHRNIKVSKLTIKMLFSMLCFLTVNQFQQQQQLLLPASASPIVYGYLNPWEVQLKHSAGLLREPMPWEDGYFDPSYHVWPKSIRQQQQQVGDKQSVKLTGSASETAVSAGKIKTDRS